MPVIAEFYGIKIFIFYDDHAEPHFHAYYGGEEGGISVKTGKLIVGKLPPRAIKLIREWLNKHKEELVKNWKLAEEHRRLEKIDPLK